MPPVNILIKPSSGNCNLRCRYCFYCDEMEKRETANYGFMSEDMAWERSGRNFWPRIIFWWEFPWMVSYILTTPTGFMHQERAPSGKS